MLPFVFVDPARTFGLAPFGIVVVLGLAVWSLAVRRELGARGYERALYSDLQFLVFVCAVVFAHVIDEVFYRPERLVSQPWRLLALWDGMSSTGGFVGTFVGALIFRATEPVRAGGFFPRRRRKAPLSLWPFADVTFATLPVGYAIGRLACALVHDHPGALASASNPLAVAWPTGPEDGLARTFGPFVVVTGGSTPRYDLGLLEVLVWLLLLAAVLPFWTRRSGPRAGKPPTLGTTTALVCLGYAPLRFALDFLRMTDAPGADPRWAGLTFAQWVMVPLAGLGALGLRRALAGRAGEARPDDATLEADVRPAAKLAT